MEKRALESERVIARFEGSKEGPLLIVLGAMHGNEPMGLKAISILYKMLEVEPITNPGFEFCGNFLGLIGNVSAYKLNERFIDKDINRQWSDENIEKIKNTKPEKLDTEDVEILEILELIDEAIAHYHPKKLYILDLHTTSSHGGIFTIPSDTPESLDIAKQLHAPVVTGMLNGIKGTTLHYFKGITSGVNTIAVTFEAGQHEEHKSINRAIAAIINFMRSIGCVRSDDVENIHDEILLEYSRQLPKVTELVMRHPVEEEDNFKMEPGFSNFQEIKKGMKLAEDKNGEILSPIDGRILMPLYQKQGEDGFFIVREIK